MTSRLAFSCKCATSKTAPHLARSRNSRKSNFSLYLRLIKRSPFQDFSLLAGDEARLGFAPRSENSAFKPKGLVAPFLRYPDLRPYANPLLANSKERYRASLYAIPHRDWLSHTKVGCGKISKFCQILDFSASSYQSNSDVCAFLKWTRLRDYSRITLYAE